MYVCLLCQFIFIQDDLNPLFITKISEKRGRDKNNVER